MSTHKPKPLKFTRAEVQRIKGSSERVSTALHEILAAKFAEVQKKGHGGNWTSDRYRVAKIRLTTSTSRPKQAALTISQVRQRILDDEPVFIIPSVEEYATNPGPSADAHDLTAAVESYDKEILERRLFPELSDIDFQTKAEGFGTFRTAMHGATGTGLPSTAAPFFQFGSKDDKAVRAQVLGVEPSFLIKLDAKKEQRIKERLIKDLETHFLSAMGVDADEKKKIQEALKDRGRNLRDVLRTLLETEGAYTDMTAGMMDEFGRIISMYHHIRARNGPYMRALLPTLTKRNVGVALPKLLDTLMPSPDAIINGGTVAVIRDEEVLGISARWWESIWRLMKGEDVDYEAQEQLKDAQRSTSRFIAANKTTTKATAKLSKITLKALSMSGNHPDYGLEITDKTLEALKDDIATAHTDRMDPTRRNKPVSFTCPRNDIPDALRAMQRGNLAHAIGRKFWLIPLHNSGFSRQPKGWSRKWMIPTIQIFDEYWDVMNEISPIDLMYMIASRAKNLFDYDLTNTDILLLLSMIQRPEDHPGVPDPPGPPPAPPAPPDPDPDPPEPPGGGGGGLLSEYLDDDSEEEEGLVPLEHIALAWADRIEFHPPTEEGITPPLVIRDEDGSNETYWLEQSDPGFANSGGLAVDTASYDELRDLLERHPNSDEPPIGWAAAWAGFEKAREDGKYLNDDGEEEDWPMDGFMKKSLVDVVRDFILHGPSEEEPPAQKKNPPEPPNIYEGDNQLGTKTWTSDMRQAHAWEHDLEGRGFTRFNPPPSILPLDAEGEPITLKTSYDPNKFEVILEGLRAHVDASEAGRKKKPKGKGKGAKAKKGTDAAKWYKLIEQGGNRKTKSQRGKAKALTFGLKSAGPEGPQLVQALKAYAKHLNESYKPDHKYWDSGLESKKMHERRDAAIEKVQEWHDKIKGKGGLSRGKVRRNPVQDPGFHTQFGRHEIGTLLGPHGHVIDGGKSSSRGGGREIIVVDQEQYPSKFLDDLYQEFIQYPDVKNRWPIASRKLINMDRFPNPDGWTYDAYKPSHPLYNKTWTIDEINNMGGSCRHLGILNAAIFERAIKEGIVNGKVYYVRGAGHGWCQVQSTRSGKMYVLDAAQGNWGEINDLDAKGGYGDYGDKYGDAGGFISTATENNPKPPSIPCPRCGAEHPAHTGYCADCTTQSTRKNPAKKPFPDDAIRSRSLRREGEWIGLHGGPARYIWGVPSSKSILPHDSHAAQFLTDLERFRLTAPATGYPHGPADPPSSYGFHQFISLMRYYKIGRGEALWNSYEEMLTQLGNPITEQDVETINQWAVGQFYRLNNFRPTAWEPGRNRGSFLGDVWRELMSAYREGETGQMDQTPRLGDRAMTVPPPKKKGKPKKNPVTAECQKCGHRQTMKSLNDKCEKCGHGAFKSGKYTRRANPPFNLAKEQQALNYSLLAEMEEWCQTYLDPAIKEAMAKGAPGRSHDLSVAHSMGNNRKAVIAFNKLGQRYADMMDKRDTWPKTSTYILHPLPPQIEKKSVPIESVVGSAWSHALNQPRRAGTPGYGPRSTFVVTASQSQDHVRYPISKAKMKTMAWSYAQVEHLTEALKEQADWYISFRQPKTRPRTQGKKGGKKKPKGKAKKNPASHKCSYKQTSRHKSCGDKTGKRSVRPMRGNKKVWKCADCGAKYEMRT